MGFIDIFVGVLITAVFVLALVSFGSQLAIDNNSAQNIINDESIEGLNDSLTNYLGNIQETAQIQRNVSEQQEAQGGSQDEGFGLTAIVGAVFTFFGTMIGSINIIFSVLHNVFGIPSLLLNVLLGIVIIITLILIWRLIKVGGR